MSLLSPIFVVCEWCGNKRCPHAESKLFRCTDSNALDQVGVPMEPREPPPKWNVVDKQDSDYVFMGPYATRGLAEQDIRQYGFLNIAIAKRVA